MIYKFIYYEFRENTTMRQPVVLILKTTRGKFSHATNDEF